MTFTDSFFLDVRKIHVAHEFILDRIYPFSYPKGRGYHGLVYTLTGKAEYRFSTGERLTISPGDLLFLSPNTAYSIVTEKEFHHYTVNFDIHPDTSRPGALASSVCLLQGKNTAQLERCFRKLIGIWTAKKAGFEMQSIGCLYELLSLFYGEYTDERDSPGSRRLQPAKTYLEQHFHEPVSLEQLASLSGMSVTHFRREWKKRYTEPPVQYRDSIRLYYAREYLNTGYYTVSEIAEKCGFEDVSYFVRFFKKKTGITPGAFRDQAAWENRQDKAANFDP